MYKKLISGLVAASLVAGILYVPSAVKKHREEIYKEYVLLAEQDTVKVHDQAFDE